MRKVLPAWTLVAMVATVPACTVEQTWTGTISDSQCGLYHEWDEHGQPTTEKECTLKCVTSGAKYILRSEGRTYQIDNQDHPDLAAQAGGAVQLTGGMTNDSITVSSITPR